MTAPHRAGAQQAAPAPPAAPPPGAGGDSVSALRPALLRLDLRLRVAVEGLRDEIAARAADPLRGLYISDAEVDALLAGTPQPWNARELLARAPEATAPRLLRLATLWPLGPFDLDAALIALAPEIDVRYERLYGYLQDDVSRRRPTANLVLQLLHGDVEDQVAARERLSPQGPLFAAGLLTVADEAGERLPLLSRPLKLDDRIVAYLLGSDTPDGRLAGCARLVLAAPPAPGENGGDPAVVEGLARVLAAGTGERSPGPLVYLHGQTAAARAAAAAAACGAAGLPYLGVRVDELAAGTAARTLALVEREALLQGAVVGFEGVDPLLNDDPAAQGLAGVLRRCLTGLARPVVLQGDQRWEPATWGVGGAAIRVELAPLTLERRRGLWSGALGTGVPAAVAHGLAGRYSLDAAGARGVAAAAALQARRDGRAAPTPDDYQVAARAASAPPLAGLARRVEPRHGWDDIVLPPDGLAQLREIAARARHALRVLETWGFGRKLASRSGLTALFAGQPGTGKTLAAEIIAAELGLELYRIDLAAIVSKYIGETEKNLDAIFGAAEKGDAVLLFDEADALFGKRSDVKDAHDRYANVEIAYLLQRLEAYNGVALLTTNLRGNLDDAFLRRLDFVIEFPMPDEAERRRIWGHSLPPEAPLAGDVDLDFLARRFRLAGGHIRNICVTAAFLAAEDGDAIAMRHLVRGVRREYQKLGKLVAPNDFEPYFGLLQGA